MTSADDSSEQILSPDFLMGSDSDSVLAMTGWIGQDPRGGDIAHLLIYPLRHGVAPKMRLLAQLAGTTPAIDGAPGTVAQDDAHVTIGKEFASLHVGEAGLLERPVSEEWIHAARERRQIVVTIGTQAYSGRPQELEDYLYRIKTLYYGLMTVSLD